MHLPNDQNPFIAPLTRVFAHTSATYKFYWLLAIVQAAEQDQRRIEKRSLFARMIAEAWYTVHYFKVSFGPQDLIMQAAHALREAEGLTVDVKKELLIEVLQGSERKATRNVLWHFNKQVPHWFLSAWIGKLGRETDTVYRQRIYRESQQFMGDCLYALHDEWIELNPNWIAYLKAHARIIKDFVYWNLTLFLQARNPNVPDLANKLLRPALRGSLSQQRQHYWNLVFDELGTVDCLFTQTQLRKEKYALDHFVPHAFVSHDLIWNLIPIEPSFNSTKSDKLPNLDKHFDRFFELQKTAYELVRHRQPKNKLLQDYLSIMPGLSDTGTLNYTQYKESIQPLVTIAGNNGFGYLEL